jgi:uncharacterized protein
MYKPRRAHKGQRRRLCVYGVVVLTSWFCTGPSSAAARTSSLEQLMALTGVLDHGPASMDRVIADLRARNPDVPPALWDNYAARINDHSALVHTYAPIYRRHVSGADTRALLAFFQSPLGTRYIAALAQVADETDAAAQSWAVSVANQLLREEVAPNADDAPSSTTPEYPETERTRAVRELIRVSGALAEARTISAQMILRLRENNLGDALIQRAQQRLSSGEALSELWVPAYVRHFSPEDVQALSTFFRTPVGRRWVEVSPRIQEECLLAASALGKEASRGAIREVLGPLPQWRLLHPVQAPPSPESNRSP